MPGFRSPNYTQAPNELFDVFLSQMKEAELRVVLAICRQTFGFHRETCRLSNGQLMKLTGLSENGVIMGAQAGMDRGILGKEVDGKRKTTWFLIVEDEVKTTSPSEVVLNASEKLPHVVRYSTSRSEVDQAYLKKEIKKGEIEIKDIVSKIIPGNKLTPAQIWERVRDVLQAEASRTVYREHVESSHVVDYEEGKFTVAVRDPEWMASRLSSTVTRIIRAYVSSGSAEFVAMEMESA